MAALISTIKLKEELGLSHRRIQQHILKYKIKVIPSGIHNVGEGKPQRVSLVDKDYFMECLTAGARKTARGKKKKVE